MCDGGREGVFTRVEVQKKIKFENVNCDEREVSRSAKQSGHGAELNRNIYRAKEKGNEEGSKSAAMGGDCGFSISTCVVSSAPFI